MAAVRFAGRTAWRCPSCLHPSTSERAFSTAVALRALGPESPRYIDVPELVQAEQHRKKVLKGLLPVPRDIFSRSRGGKARITDDYIRAATSDALAPAGSSTAEQASRNTELAEAASLRKKNLRLGLLALKNRHHSAQKLAKRNSAVKRKRKGQLLHRVREDEMLTSPTVAQTLLNGDRRVSSNIPDPNREQRLAERAARLQVAEAAKTSLRQDALHTLYMHARNFIVSEKQLDRAIEDTFGTQDNPKTWAGQGASIWAEGAPPTVATMLARASGASSSRREDDDDFRARTTKERLGRIAEELTGGKM